MDVNPTQITELVIEGGAFALVAWVVLHMFRVSLPNIIKQFRDENKEARDDYLSSLDQMRLDHKEDRQLWLEELRRIRESVDKLHD